MNIQYIQYTDLCVLDITCITSVTIRCSPCYYVCSTGIECTLYGAFPSAHNFFPSRIPFLVYQKYPEDVIIYVTVTVVVDKPLTSRSIILWFCFVLNTEGFNFPGKVYPVTSHHHHVYVHMTNRRIVKSPFPSIQCTPESISKQ